MATVLTTVSRLRVHAWMVIVLIGGASSIAVSVAETTSAFAHILILALSAVAIAAMGWFTFRTPTPARWAWLALLGFEIVNWLADIIYFLEDQNSTRSESASDVFGMADPVYVAAYLFGFAALVLLIRYRRPGRDMETWLDAGIASLAIAALFIAFILPPIVLNSGISNTTVLLLTVYPLMDLLIVAALIRLLLGAARNTLPLLLVVASFSMTLIADTAYNALLAGFAIPVDGSMMEGLYLFAVYLMTAATAAPGADTISDPADSETLGIGTSRRLIVLALGALTVPVTLLFLAVFDPDNPMDMFLGSISVIIIMLVLWRVKGLVDLVQRQAALLEEQARTDVLTGLPNRRTWEYELERADAHFTQTQQPIAVALIDLDFFKKYNDTRGHPAADALLTTCAQTWMKTLNDRGFIARYGGEEFAVMIPGLRDFRVRGVLEELRKATPSGQTVSIGFAMRLPGEAITETVRRADLALYTAKRSGRNRVEEHGRVRLGKWVPPVIAADLNG